MAHKKGQGSASNGRDSHGQRRGIKLYDGDKVKAGGIIVRQVGMRYMPGKDAGLGKDYTIFALKNGTVKFGRSGDKVTVNILTE